MLVIRPEEPSDIQAVATINQAAFGRPEEARLVDALRSRGAISCSLVAELNGEQVGHVLLSPALITGSALAVAGLGPLAVSPQHQRQGVGAALMRAAITASRELALPAIAVLGNPGYYSRFGFLPARRYGVECEFEVPEEYFILLELREGALQGQHGGVRYQPEFYGV